MTALIKRAIVAIAMLMTIALPAFADEIVHSKAAMVNVVMDQSNNKVHKAEAVRIVNAVFSNAKKQGLDPLLIISLIKTESRFRTTARSSYGAQGLMQVVPRFHRDKLRGRSPTNIETNIEVGTQILSDCIDSNRGNLKRALQRCYSSNAKNYYAKLKAGHNEARKAEIQYRFENELPITVASRFENPKGYYPVSASAATFAAAKEPPVATAMLVARNTY
ncbi:putative transglycosylase [Ralstonia phage RP31]|uniref:Putative transglycosylase n=2 Tax=Ripduovirus RP12 TaxID=2560700 RepID=A0A1L7N0Z2_9CAUD|nr:transglycosylase [Ralstonia phage RP12]BAW19140.1 putative transglycosylase [Ralstonia phage RP12]BAW19426.1 putative transglycosylase [Ralstonia phage RP31]